MPVNLKKKPTAINHSELPFSEGCNNQWLAQQSGNTKSLSPELISWLFDKNSLTQRLQSCAEHFEVIVLREGKAIISAGEQSLFSPAENISSREVLLMCDGRPQVYARTLIPRHTLDYADSLLKTLGNTSLGEVLFRAGNMQRQAFETTSFSTTSTMAQFSKSINLEAEHDLWARRSIFTLDGQALMVSEVFLPNSYAYQEAVK